MHLAALLSLVTCQLSFWVYGALSGFLFLSLGCCLIVHGTYHSYFIHRVNPIGYLHWHIQQVDRRAFVAKLTGGYVHPYLVILHFRSGWYPFSVIVPSDAVDKEAFRRLRSLLRWQRWNYYKTPDNPL